MVGRVAESRIKRTKRGAKILSFSEDVAKARARVEEYFVGPPRIDDATLAPRAIAELRTEIELLNVAEESLRDQSEELVSAQRRLEVERRRYRELLDLSPEAQFVTDRHGTIQEVNAAASALFAVDARLLRGKPLWSVVGGNEAKTLRAATESVHNRGQIEVELTVADSNEAEARVTLRGMRMKDPLFFAWVVRLPFDETRAIVTGARATTSARSNGQVDADPAESAFSALFAALK